MNDDDLRNVLNKCRGGMMVCMKKGCIDSYFFPLASAVWFLKIEGGRNASFAFLIEVLTDGQGKLSKCLPKAFQTISFSAKSSQSKFDACIVTHFLFQLRNPPLIFLPYRKNCHLSTLQSFFQIAFGHSCACVIKPTLIQLLMHLLRQLSGKVSRFQNYLNIFFAACSEKAKTFRRTLIKQGERGKEGRTCVREWRGESRCE